ncbi:MAG: methyltransferase domain-containing protein [Blastocatellia bacterium]|nr:methyltransferase domain-containing protein [Blastocatellia bacterium]
MTRYLSDSYNLEDINVASSFDELSFWSAQFGILLFNNLTIERNIKILDLACGNGFPLFELAQRFGSSCQVIGVDIWTAGLERARQKQNILQLPNITILEANAENLPFSSEEFNLITINLGINNFSNVNKVLSECHRVLKPNGKIALTTNVIGHFQEFYHVFREILEKFGDSSYLENLKTNETHRGSKELFSQLLESTGFMINSTIEDKFIIRYSNANALFNHSLVKVGFLGGWKSIVKVEDREEIFSQLEKELDKIVIKFNELKMSVPMLYLEAQKLEK